MYTNKYQEEPIWGLSYCDEVESWKEHPYLDVQVSNLGNCRNPHTKKPLHVFQNGSGYYYVTVETLGRSVHVLVAETWHPKRHKGYFDEVDHINRVRTDNRASNLRWVTHRLNQVNKDCKGYYKTRNNLFRVERVVLGKRFCLGTYRTEAEAREVSENWKPRIWILATMFENVISGVRESIRDDRESKLRLEGFLD